jgi:hypothetical protein
MDNQLFLEKLLFAISTIIALAGCSGSGGGSDSGSGTSGPTGSATFSGLTRGSASNVCFSTTTIGTAASCSVDGTASNQASTATCSAGAANVVCNISGDKYTLATSGSTSADTACVNAGGTVQVTCKITTSGTCTGAGGTWTAASSPDVSNSTNCSNAGGVFYTTLQNITGSMPSASLIAGNNLISADPTDVATALGLGQSNLDNTNLNLVSMSATAAIGSYWGRSFYMTSISTYNFRSTEVKFSASSPVSTSSTITIKTNTAKIYYQ